MSVGPRAICHVRPALFLTSKAKLEKRRSFEDDDRTHVLSMPPRRARVAVYFEGGSHRQRGRAEHVATLRVWREQWERAGFEAVILNESIARRHPKYHELRKRYQALPTVNPHNYEIACFLRYLAMAAIGGGYMTDYDVLPIQGLMAHVSFPPVGQFTIHEKHIPALVSATAGEYARVATLMAKVPWRQQPTHFQHKNRSHVSDMHAINFLSQQKTARVHMDPCLVVQASVNLTRAALCQRMRELGCSRLPMAVHYSHSAMARINPGGLPWWPGTHRPAAVRRSHYMNRSGARLEMELRGATTCQESCLPALRAPISDRHRLIFIHVPKAGGSTIERSPLFNDRRAALGGGYLGGHRRWDDFAGDAACASYHSFAMVRHPCSRLLSLWAYYSQGLGNHCDQAWVSAHVRPLERRNFTEFVLGLGARGWPWHNAHFQTQVGMLLAPGGAAIGVSQVLVMERWAESMARLAASRHPPLDVRGLSGDGRTQAHALRSGHGRCVDGYTPETWATLTRLYALDFCALGYGASGPALEEEAPPIDALLPEALSDRVRECCARFEVESWTEVPPECRRGRGSTPDRLPHLPPAPGAAAQTPKCVESGARWTRASRNPSNCSMSKQPKLCEWRRKVAAAQRSRRTKG